MTPAERNRADFPHCHSIVSEFRDAFGTVKDLHMRDMGNVHGKPHDYSGMHSVRLTDIHLKPNAAEIVAKNVTALALRQD